MIVKIMSGQDMPDDDPKKRYTIHDDVADAHFREGTDIEPCWVDLVLRDGSRISIPVGGNVYVMNDAGKTVSTFSMSYLHSAQKEAL